MYMYKYTIKKCRIYNTVKLIAIWGSELILKSFFRSILKMVK